jgi:hypothetical protein
MITDQLWAWMTETPDGQHSTIGAELPGVGSLPLITRHRATLEKFELIARRHRQKTGQRVWLRCWTAYSDEEDLP